MSALRLLEQEGINYLLQINAQHENIVVDLTDLKNIWQLQISEHEAVEKFKEGNPLIRSNDKWISEYVLSMMKNSSTGIRVTTLGSDININFSANVTNLPTKLDLLLSLQPSEKVYKDITVPMLMIINELKFREDKLLSILKAKDIEIKEFKFEGANITRRNAITEPFNSNSFDNECLSTFQERSKSVLKDPCSVICPILNTLYPELSCVLASANIKEEKDQDISANPMHTNGESKTSEAVNSNNIIIKETDLELKRKLSETLSRTKRTKKLYKI